MTYIESTQGCNLNLLPQGEVSNPSRDRGNTWGSTIGSKVLPSSVSLQRKSCLGGGRRAKEARLRARRCVPSGQRRWQAHKSWGRTWLKPKGKDCRVPEAEFEYLCLDLWRYVKYRQWSNRAQVECQSHQKACSIETTSFCSRKEQTYRGRSRETLDCQVHQGGLLPWLASQCRHGEKV